MAVVDSKQEMLSIDDILKIAYEETNEQMPYDLAYAAVIKEFQDPNGTFLRYGNTIFIIHGSQKMPGTGIFRALNADTAKNYVESLRKFSVDAYKKGYWLLVTKFADSSLINLFRMLMQDPPREGMGYLVKKTKDGQFQVNFTLGPKTNNPEEPPEMEAQESQDIGMQQSQSMPSQGALNQLSAPQQQMPQKTMMGA